MDTTLFLGGKESTTLSEISKMMGKETIHLLNTGESRGQSASYSMNYQSLGKELMSMDEIAVMDGSKCILQVRGVRPFLSSKYDIEKHPNYKYLADFDSKLNFDITDFVNVFKEDRAKLLEGVNKKTTKHVVIEINEDEDTADAAADTNNVETAPAPNTEVLPTEPANETTEPTNQDDNQDNKNDNSYNEEDEDDTDDFDPEDTEIV
jgi:type IV secretory pathway TraG/TraD family ATPase VirD4